MIKKMKKSGQVPHSHQRVIKGRTSGVAYDTGWTARVLEEDGAPLFPECVQWLLENQSPDGSWGGQVLHYHDRLLSTLSALIALKELERRRYKAHIEKGETYIWENLEKLELDSNRLIGSELLFPSLMEQAESAGLNLPFHKKVYQREYQLRLERIEAPLWYSPYTTLSFSLEFLGDAVDKERLKGVQLPNGSVATSPATTAFFLQHTRDPRAFSYLRENLALTGDGSVMTIYPINVFEYGWTMYNLMLAGLYLERYNDLCDFLFKHLTSSGIGSSKELPLTDADDTAVVCKALHSMGRPVDYEMFDTYYTGEYYLTFDFELDPSVSTNIHMLDFINSCSRFPHREEIREQLVQFLNNHLQAPGFWVDKWHISPYYPTSHAVIALCEVDPSLSEKGISWILKTQHENGMWGHNGGTLEETAYAVQALLYYHQKTESLDISRIKKALPFTGQGVLLPSSGLLELWVGKALYTPLNVVLSSLVSASTMYNTAVWNLCSGWSV